ncbi:MAG: cysteine desulfurase, partial [Bacteroidota bacterium]
QDFYTSGNANIHRGIYQLSMSATQAYEAVRHQVRDFLGAKSEKEIVFTSGTTQGINLVAHSFLSSRLQPGDKVLVSAMEHHANLIPWQQLCRATGAEMSIIEIDEQGEIVWDDFVERLGPSVKMMALVHISNSLGTINPVKKMIAAAHEHGVPVLLDAAQSVAHYPLDVQELDCDFMVFSGHKIFGPTGIGVLFGKAELLHDMPPFLTGGGMIRQVDYQQANFAPIPQRFEAGTPHIAGVVGLGAAIRYVKALDREAVLQAIDQLSHYAHQQLETVEGLRIIGQAKQKSGIISFVMEQAHPHDIATILNESQVAIRAGHHCTQPLMRHLGLPATVRASLSIYNTKQDIDGLMAGLKAVKEIFG